jgi:outer membrane protein TolC
VIAPARTVVPGLLLVMLAGCADRAVELFEPDLDRHLLRLREDKASLTDRLPVVSPPVAAEPEFPGEGPIELTVEQAVVLALGRNRDLSVARLGPVIAGAFEQIERGRFDPEVFGEASFAREEALESARSTGDQFSVRGDDGSVAAGIRGETPLGTTLELRADQRRTISDRAPEQQSARVGLTITQSLLRGFGPAVNLVSVRQASLESEASLYELRGFVEALVAETETAYWEHLLARRKIEIFERSLELSRSQAEQLDQRIEIGAVPRTEAAAARSEVALREQALIDARSELQRTTLRLVRLTNSSTDRIDDRPVVAVSEVSLAGSPLGDLAERIDLARRMRPDLNEARLRLEQGRLETIRSSNGLLPRLDLFLALGKTGFANTFSASFRELDGPTYDFTAGVTLAQSLGREAARGAQTAAIATREQAAAAVANLEQLVEVDVRLAAIDAERARQQIAATITTRELQEETARAELERFDVGASTALLVAQAQRDLLASQIAEVEALAAHRIALVSLHLAEGTLLERRGVSVGEPAQRSLERR